MKNRELMEKLGRMDPEADFFGTPGMADAGGLRSDAKKVMLIGSRIPNPDKRGFHDRGLNWRLQQIASMHRSVAWKKQKIYETVAHSGEDYERNKLDEAYRKILKAEWKKYTNSTLKTSGSLPTRISLTRILSDSAADPSPMSPK